MARSIVKVPFVHRAMFKKSLESKFKLKFNLENLLLDQKAKFNRNVCFWNRSSTINKNLLNNKTIVYNGYRFLYLNVNTDIVGYKFGDFVRTRRKPKHKGKKRQTKKIIKKLENGISY